MRRQRSKYVHQAVDNLIIGSALKVGTSDTHTEEGIAAKANVFFLTIIADPTWGVPWGVEDAEDMIAKGDDIAVSEVSADGRHFHW